MQRLLTASALVGLVLATAAGGQPPKLEPPKKADKSAPDPTDAAIARALATDPDVKVAQAKIQLAEAELAKARLVATQKVLSAQTAVQAARSGVLVAEQELEGTAQMLRIEKVPDPTSHFSYRVAATKLEVAKTKLTQAEIEWKLLTGAGDTEAKYAELSLRWFMHMHQDTTTDRLLLSRWAGWNQALSPPAIKGPIPDRLRAALDKPVKLGAKGETVKFQAALDAFKKEAGLDVPVRGGLLQSRPRLDPKGEMVLGGNGEPVMIVPQITSEGETLPVGAWLQLFQDECGGTFYVREYGLLIADKKAGPPDAPTLTEFWKQKPPAPKSEPKPDPVPEPKPK